jgi:hypothetical protein
VLALSLERQLLPELRTLSRPAVFFNSGGRVIASSSPQFASGMRVSPRKKPTPRRRPIDWQLLPASSLR